MAPRLIAGRYELVEQLGASTWRATDNELQRDVVVQIPALDTGLARLTHPSIAHLFDQGEEDGERYAVLEYLPGGTLEQRLDAGPLSEAESRQIAADLTAALAYAHEHGVTHGALGPASVLFSSEGQAKVAGFTGDGSPEDDERALGAILQTLAAGTAGATDVTAILRPEPVAVGRRPVALIVAAAVALARGRHRSRSPRDRRRLGLRWRDRLRPADRLDRLDAGHRRRTADDDARGDGSGDHDRADGDRPGGDDGAPGDDGAGADHRPDHGAADDRAAPDDRACGDDDRASGDHRAAARDHHRR